MMPMLTSNDVSKLRLVAQQLNGTTFKTAPALVQYFGAMQAQDYSMSKWAVGTRIAVAEKQVEQAIDDGRIVRTHVLRPTWHLVAAEDANWMLQLTAPHIRKAYLTMGYKLGIDHAFLKRSNKTIARLLQNGNYLTREEVMAHIKLPGEMKNDFRPSLVMMHAELAEICCNGPMRGKEFTYALLHERVNVAAPITRDEALARLAERYFLSHGPATAADFAWWSGLPAADVRKAVTFVKDKFKCVDSGNTTYMMHEKHLDALDSVKDTIHLLPAFDEFLISYKDRTPSIPLQLQKHAFTANGIFRPIIVVAGQVVGVWKRTVKKDSIVFEPQYLVNVTQKKRKLIAEQAEQFCRYAGKKLLVV